MTQTYDHGELKIDDTEVGVFDITMNVAHTEHDATTTTTPPGESEFIAGKRVVSFAFSTYKEANTDDLALKTAKAATLKVRNEAGAFNSYAGNLILFSKDFAGKIDGLDVMKYSGKISGAFTESKGAGI